MCAFTILCKYGIIYISNHFYIHMVWQLDLATKYFFMEVSKND